MCQILAGEPPRGNAATATAEMWRPNTMTAREVLRAAVAAGMQITVDGKGLVWEAASAPPAALLEALARHKPEIIALLSTAAKVAPGTIAEEDDDAERAAVIEFNGGIPRPWAEALARLAKQRRLADVPDRQWNRLRDDFIDFCMDWAGPAEALGWRPRDLLGWDVRYPFSPIAKRLGLTWKIAGARVVSVERDEIVIERQPGFHTTLPRLPH
jgi:hypothetical protein